MTLNILLDKEYYKLKALKIKEYKIYTNIVPKVAWRMTHEYKIRNSEAWKYAEKHMNSCIKKYHKRMTE